MKTIKETKVVNKGDGWKAETVVEKFGLTWEILTFKGGRGTITCFAQSGVYKPSENGFESFSYVMFQDPRKTLIQEKARATEKSISEVHSKGLELFSRLSDYK